MIVLCAWFHIYFGKFCSGVDVTDLNMCVCGCDGICCCTRNGENCGESDMAEHWSRIEETSKKQRGEEYWRSYSG